MSLLSAGERERRESWEIQRERERQPLEKQRREKRTFEWQTVLMKGVTKKTELPHN